MLSAFRANFRAFAIELKQVLHYRAEFWISFVVSTAGRFVLAYLLWTAVFAESESETMGGYTLGAMMVYFLCAPMVARIVQGSGFGFLSQEIYQGTLNRYLVYPMSFQGYKLAAYLARALIYFGQLVGVLALAVLAIDLPPEVTPSLSSSALFVLSTFFAVIAFFLMGSCLELLAFWADNVWSLMVILKIVSELLGGVWIPLSLFPDWANAILAYTPFPYLVFFPTRALMGDATWTELPQAIAVLFFWGLVLQGLYLLIWMRGRLKYSGVGI